MLTMVHLIDAADGIYIPRNFYENFDFVAWNLDISDFAALSDPDNPGYWDAWDVVLRDAQHLDSYGRIWRLYQANNGDLLAVRDGSELGRPRFMGSNWVAANARGEAQRGSWKSSTAPFGWLCWEKDQ